MNSAIKHFILFVPSANTSAKYPHACMWSSENPTKYSDSSGSMANLGANSSARSFMMMSATDGVFVIKTSAYADVNNSDYVWYAE